MCALPVQATKATATSVRLQMLRSVAFISLNVKLQSVSTGVNCFLTSCRNWSVTVHTVRLVLCTNYLRPPSLCFL